MEMLSPKQRWSARRAVKRLNLWHGSVRSGKTVGTIFRWADYVGREAPPGDLLMVGKTIDSLKRNVINPLIELVGTANCTYFSGRREVRLFGRTISTVGASDERSEQKIRGMTAAGALGDEITLWPESFFQMMLSRLSVEGAKFFGTTNPDNPNHWLIKNYINRRNSLDLFLCHFKIDDNPYLSQAYVDSLKNEYTGLWYKRFILGQWCAAEGSIYDFFDIDKNCIGEPRPEASYYVAGYDYGTTNPTTFGVYGVNPLAVPRVWLDREYYYDPTKQTRQQTDAEFSQDLRKFLAPYQHKLRTIVGDPSAESFTLQLKRDGFHGLTDANNEVLDGIRTVARMMKGGEYKIGRDCQETIDECFGYVWDPKAQAKGLDAPLKKNDHAMDRDRYVLHTLFGQKKYDIEKFLD